MRPPASRASRPTGAPTVACASSARMKMPGAWLPAPPALPSLYLRPVLFGINPQLGIKSARDVMFAVMASAVGTYSGGKSLMPVTAVISRNYDRAATYGSGGYKLGANYAQSLHAYNLAHKMGYKELLFLDSATHSHIEEFGSSNFFAIKHGCYITPNSPSVLPSITNKSLRKVAEEIGLKVERRTIFLDELDTFEEVNSCGTAVVITPISRIDDKVTLESGTITREYKYGDACGTVSQKLYSRIVGIQTSKGKKLGDLVIWDAPDLDYICYRVGSNLARTVIKQGVVVR